MAVDLDELAARARERMQPAWDEVREQRVLASISRPRAAARPSRLAWLATGTLAVAVVILVVLLSRPEPPENGWLELEDGSVCALDLGARVKMREESPELVRIEQERGRVVYAVSHRPERAFEVVARPVIVRVRGTRFAVEVTDESVRVSVEEGHVEVESRAGTTDLWRGDALRVARTGAMVSSRARGDADDAPVATADVPNDEAHGAERARARSADARDLRPEGARADELDAESAPATDARHDGAREPATATRDADRATLRSDGRAPTTRDGVRDGAPDATSARGAASDEGREATAREAASNEGRTATSAREPASDDGRTATSDRAGDASDPGGAGDVAGNSSATTRADASDGQAGPSAAELLAQADAARRAGAWTDAATTLERVLRDHADDPRAPSAAFTLGRVRRRLGQLASAAQAFERARTLAPNGPLAEDALAEEAWSWSAAGDRARATGAARHYLERYPGGLHAARMRSLLTP